MKFWVILLLATGLSTHLNAQVVFKSLDEVLQYADKHGLVAQQSGLQERISGKEEVINKSGLLPKLNVFGTADYFPILTTQLIPEAIFGGSSDKFRKVQFGLPWSFSTGVELTVPVVNFEKWEQLKRFKLQSAQTTLTGEVNKEAQHIQLMQWYYQVLLTRELVKLNLANQQVSDELLRIMEQRKSNGIINPADYNRTKNLQLDVKGAGVDYGKMYQQSLIVLHQLLNLPDTLELQINDSMANHNKQEAFQAIDILNRPAWKESIARVAVVEQQLKELQKASLPKLSFSGKYTYQWQMKPSTNQNINFDFSSIGLRLDFPLFQGNYYNASKQRSALQLELAKTIQQQTKNDLSRQQAEWWNNYRAAEKKLLLLKEKKLVAADNLRIAQLNVKEGVMEFEEFNNIFQEYNKANMEWLQNWNDAMLYSLLLTQNK